MTDMPDDDFDLEPLTFFLARFLSRVVVMWTIGFFLIWATEPHMPGDAAGTSAIIVGIAIGVTVVFRHLRSVWDGAWNRSSRL